MTPVFSFARANQLFGQNYFPLQYSLAHSLLVCCCLMISCCPITFSNTSCSCNDSSSTTCCDLKRPCITCLMQVARPRIPAPLQTATPAPEEEEEEMDKEAALGVHKTGDSPRTAKRQKMSQPKPKDVQHVEQPVEDARKVAAATKDALGLKGNRSSLFHMTYCQVEHMASSIRIGHGTYICEVRPLLCHARTNDIIFCAWCAD